MRRWLAQMIYPEVFNEMERFAEFAGRVQRVHRWLAEFPDIRAATEWVIDRKPDVQIEEFREMLRRRRSLSL